MLSTEYKTNITAFKFHSIYNHTTPKQTLNFETVMLTSNGVENVKSNDTVTGLCDLHQRPRQQLPTLPIELHSHHHNLPLTATFTVRTVTDQSHFYKNAVVFFLFSSFFYFSSLSSQISLSHSLVWSERTRETEVGGDFKCLFVLTARENRYGVSYVLSILTFLGYGFDLDRRINRLFRAS